MHCTGWVISVVAYLVWDAYETGRLWWLGPRIRSAIRALPVAAMRLGMGSNGYTDLVRLLGVIDRARWGDVPANKHERSQGRPGGDHCPLSRPVEGADYMYVDPTTGLPVDTWAAKRRSAGMYPGGSYFPGARGNSAVCVSG